MSCDASSEVMETPKVEKTEPAVVSKCSTKITENGQAVDQVPREGAEGAALQNGDCSAATESSSSVANDEKMDEMFTEDMVNDMKQELADDVKEKVAENESEFTDQCDQQDSEALEIKMKESEKNVALQLFQQGKRNLLIEDFDAAVETLASACEKYSSIYGDLGAECGEVLMAYGHALIQLWREESSCKKENDELKSVEDTAVDGVKENGIDAETNDEENEDEDPEMSEETAVETVTNGVEEEKVEEPAASEKSSNEEAAQPNDDTIGDSGDENNDEDDDEDCEEDEEVDNLQLAWEIFETAKNIYTKHSDDASLAKVYTKLGEISIASGNYELAIEDLKRSLDILNRFAAAKPRQLADTHFQLYTAYFANYNFDRAELELRNAKNILDEQLCALRGKLPGLTAESDEAKRVTDEITELGKLTKDMQEKLVEFNASKRQVVSAISTTIMNRMENQKPTPLNGETAGSSGSNLPSASESSSNVPVNNISHLVRKKPKNEESEKPSNTHMTNGTNGLKSKEDAEAEETTESVTVNEDSQKCKRKADDELHETEPIAKKQCVS